MRALTVLFLATVLTSSAQASEDCGFLNAYDLSEEDVSIMLSVRPAQPAKAETLLAQDTAPTESMIKGGPASLQSVGMITVSQPAVVSDSPIMALLSMPMLFADRFGRQVLEFMQVGFVTR